MTEIHESFAPVEYGYIDEKLGRVENDLRLIIRQFQLYVETGDTVYLEWAWNDLAWLANPENNRKLEWQYIVKRHNEEKARKAGRDVGVS